MIETVAGIRVARTPAQVRAWVQVTRAAGKRIALVPTMGALHAGHMTLVTAAREHADAVIVTIFVNPMQFGPKEDFAAYPRPFENDCALCAQHGVGLIYAPTPQTMYPPGFQSHVEVEQLTQGLCGAARPTHFRGVTTVVMKLLNIAMADVAVFGEKDYQQLQALKRMASDLDHPTQILGGAIAREADGLAMSSRNVYLTAAERAAAPVIVRSLRAAQALVAAGERDVPALVAQITAEHTAAGGRVDYVQIVDPDTLQPLAEIDRPARVIVATWFGRARLLDNMDLLPPT
jgi:pantoate--beta-alanine ligase